MNTPEPATSDALTASRIKAEKLAHAFVVVFGQEKTRSAEQKAVWTHLSTLAGEEGNDFQFVPGRDGWNTALAAAHIDGAKSQLRIVKRQLKFATTVRDIKPKPVTKR